MTDFNHHRKNRKPVNQRYTEKTYRNGYAYPYNKTVEATNQFVEQLYAERGIQDEFVPDHESRAARVGRTDYLDKSMHGWGYKSELADRTTGGSIGNDFANGHRGMAKAVRGAKKRARTQLRFHENQATKRLAMQEIED